MWPYIFGDICWNCIFTKTSYEKTYIVRIDISFTFLMQLDNFYIGPRTIEQYQNGILIQKSTIVTSITNIPTIILVLAISNISTVVLFIMFFVDRKEIKRKKELTKMKINDLE
jgi:hypothetical protein